MLSYLALSLLAATSAMSADAPAPLLVTPDGWVHLEESCIDCWVGAYHDRVSGAYVRYDIGGKYSYEDARKGQRTETGTAHGYPYSLTAIADARRFAQRRLEKSTGSPLDELGDLGARLMPPDGCRFLAVDLNAEGTAWHFEAAVCDDVQERRVRELLLGSGGLNRRPAESTVWRPVSITKDQLEGAKIGCAHADVHRTLGRALRSYRRGANGFVVVYHAVDGDTMSEVSLVFDQGHKLTDKQVAKLG